MTELCERRSMKILTTAVPTRNRPKLLRLTLQSLASQRRKPDRVVVFDNGTPEETSIVIREFLDVLPIEHCPSEKTLTWNENHNRAVALAKETCYLHFLHDDDLILPDFYSTAISELEKSSGKALFYCPCEFIDGEGKVFGRDFPLTKGRISPLKFMHDRAYLSPIYIPSIVLRTNYQTSHCEFSTEYRQSADVIFWAEWVSKCEDIFRSDRYLAHYRKHLGAETACNARQIESCIDEEWRTINGVAQLLERVFAYKISWLEWQKLKCLISARSQMTSCHGISDEKTRTQQHLRKNFGLLYLLLGGIAVFVRNLFFAKR